MQQGLDAMNTAVRVLKAITENRNPDPADADELRRLAPLLADGPLDELACDVIQKALERCAEVRRKAAGSY